MLCQIREQREYIQKVTRAVEEYGLPYPIVPKQPISVNMSKYVPSLLLFKAVPTCMSYACLPNFVTTS